MCDTTGCYRLSVWTVALCVTSLVDKLSMWTVALCVTPLAVINCLCGQWHYV